MTWLAKASRLRRRCDPIQYSLSLLTEKLPLLQREFDTGRRFNADIIVEKTCGNRTRRQESDCRVSPAGCTERSFRCYCGCPQCHRRKDECSACGSSRQWCVDESC